MARFTIFLTIILAAVFITSSLASSSIHPELQILLSTNPTHTLLPNIIITFRDDPSIVSEQISTQTFTTRLDKVSTFTSELKKFTIQSQSNVLEYLRSEVLHTHTIQFKSFWISNQISLNGANTNVIIALSTFPEILEIRLGKILTILDPIPIPTDVQEIIEEDDESPITPFAEWGLNDIKVPEAWALGVEGEGIIISTIDTGVRGTHVTLRNNYVGENGGWFDPYQGTPAPNDGNGHGTHTTSNIAGSLGVGVAPGSKWSACKGCSTSTCTEEALISCGEWVVCPNVNPPCINVPHLCSNSWGGGQGDIFYNRVIDGWHTVGITPVFANGNEGPNCGTANSPADQNVIGVGSTNDAKGLSLFSSKGPTTAGGLKPDISAPGTNIRSAWSTSDTAYFVSSGTSMACPHVAGVVALIKSANLSNNTIDLTYSQVQNYLFKNVDTDVTPTVRNCGGIDTSTFPNHSYGYGKVNAVKAVQAVLNDSY